MVITARPALASSVFANDRAKIVCRQAHSPAEHAEHYAIRRRIFVDEQAIFTGTDEDAHDHDEAVIRLLGYCDGVTAGTVRLFELDPAAHLWQGDRLAVLARYRLRGLGAPLVQCAVATAGTHGGRTMIAHIQVPNVAFFRRLGWTDAGQIEGYAGRPHQPMQIALPAPDEGRAIVARFAAGISVPDLSHRSP